MSKMHLDRMRTKRPGAELTARKMEKMRLWFEQNEGTPRKGDTRPGFDMGVFWRDCCSGTCHKELFAAALSASPKMKAALEARRGKKAARPPRKRRPRDGS